MGNFLNFFVQLVKEKFLVIQNQKNFHRMENDHCLECLIYQLEKKSLTPKILNYYEWALSTHCGFARGISKRNSYRSVWISSSQKFGQRNDIIIVMS